MAVFGEAVELQETCLPEVSGGMYKELTAWLPDLACLWLLGCQREKSLYCMLAVPPSLWLWAEMAFGTLSKQLVLFLPSIVVRATQRGWYPRLLSECEEFLLLWSLMVVFLHI